METSALAENTSLQMFTEGGSGNCGMFMLMRSTWWETKLVTWDNAPWNLPYDDGTIIIKQASDVKGGWFEMDFTDALN